MYRCTPGIYSILKAGNVRRQCAFTCLLRDSALLMQKRNLLIRCQELAVALRQSLNKGTHKSSCKAKDTGSETVKHYTIGNASHIQSTVNMEIAHNARAITCNDTQ